MTDKQKVLTIYNTDEALYYLKKELEQRQTVFWTMKTGEKIDIKKMSDSHLINTINLLEQEKIDRFWCGGEG